MKSLKLIEACFALFCKKSETLIVQNNIAKQIFKDGRDKVFQKRNLKGFKYLIGAINLQLSSDINHWACVCVSLVNKQIFYVDPLGTDDIELEEILSNWINFLANRQDLPKSDWSIGHFECDKQKDGFNCGIIIIMVIQNILNNNYRLSFNEKSLADFRIILINLIKTTKYNRKFCNKCGDNIDKSALILKCIICSRCFHRVCCNVIDNIDDFQCSICG